MEIKIVQESITRDELVRMAREQFGDLVKAVVDVEREIMAVGGELHADAEVVLIEGGSKREHTWGVNLYPEKSEDEWIEFDSMVNIKPSYGNRSRGVENPKTRASIKKIVSKSVYG